MGLALYDADTGYYARAPQRSGRAGDFFTSVDVGPVFGELLELQIAEMASILHSGRSAVTGQDLARGAPPSSPVLHLVEAGAGNGRLAADILHAARRRDPSFYESLRVHLVEASAAARSAQRATLDDVADALASSSAALPGAFEGVLIANELLDAFPVHQVVMRDTGLREIYVACVNDRLELIEGPPSTPALGQYLERLGVTLEPGWRVEINLQALDWIRDAARHLVRGFIIVIDYGHEARHLYSESHASGTLTTFAGHTMAGPEGRTDLPAWLCRPGEQDITSHVDFTSVRAAAESEGLTTVGFLDQTYFVMGILSGSLDSSGSQENLASLNGRMALKTLLMPGGLGSTHKVLLLGKGVGTPALRGCSFGGRIT